MPWSWRLEVEPYAMGPWTGETAQCSRKCTELPRTPSPHQPHQHPNIHIHSNQHIRPHTHTRTHTYKANPTKYAGLHASYSSCGFTTMRIHIFTDSTHVQLDSQPGLTRGNFVTFPMVQNSLSFTLTNCLAGHPKWRTVTPLTC